MASLRLCAAAASARSGLCAGQGRGRSLRRASDSTSLRLPNLPVYIRLPDEGLRHVLRPACGGMLPTVPTRGAREPALRRPRRGDAVAGVRPGRCGRVRPREKQGSAHLQPPLRFWASQRRPTSERAEPDSVRSVGIFFAGRGGCPPPAPWPRAAWELDEAARDGRSLRIPRMPLQTAGPAPRGMAGRALGPACGGRPGFTQDPVGERCSVAPFLEDLRPPRGAGGTPPQSGAPCTGCATMMVQGPLLKERAHHV